MSLSMLGCLHPRPQSSSKGVDVVVLDALAETRATHRDGGRAKLDQPAHVVGVAVDRPAGRAIQLDVGEVYCPSRRERWGDVAGRTVHAFGVLRGQPGGLDDFQLGRRPVLSLEGCDVRVGIRPSDLPPDQLTSLRADPDVAIGGVGVDAVEISVSGTAQTNRKPARIRTTAGNSFICDTAGLDDDLVEGTEVHARGTLRPRLAPKHSKYVLVLPQSSLGPYAMLHIEGCTLEP